MRSSIIACLVALAAPAVAQPINLQTFRTDDPTVWERVQRQSNSLPLTLEEISKLAKAGVGDATLQEMMRTRGVLALADADTLLRMKEAGASDETLASLSAFAVKPNDRLQLQIDTALVSPSTIGPAPYLYVEVIHAESKRQEAFYFVDLRNATRGMVRLDRSDPSLPMSVAGVRFNVPIKTRRYGALTVLVGVSQRADLQSLEGKMGPMSRVTRHTIDYPAVSLDSRCRLNLRVARDASVRDLYTIERDDLRCWWD